VDGQGLRGLRFAQQARVDQAQQDEALFLA